MIRFVKQRAIGERRSIAYSDLNSSTKESLNKCMNRVCTNLDEYKTSMTIVSTTSLAIIKDNSWADIERAVFHVSEQLLENHQIDSLNYKPNHIKKVEREVFIALGGCYELLRLLDDPFSSAGSTIFLTTILRKHSDIWNVALVTLRELVSTVSNIGDSLISDAHMVFLFNLLSHPSVFENALNLIEEVLATKAEVFNLRLVPNLHHIMRSFTTRQLSHFCRALALLLFEPEDRHILEGSHSLRALDLLQLRRDKLSKPSHVVERNQSLIIEMPLLLPRLMSLLRIINFAPNLSELISHQIMVPAPLFSYEILYHMLGIDESESDWDYFNDLVDVARVDGGEVDEEDTRIQKALLDAFTPNMTSSSPPSMDMNNILSVIHAAIQLGVASESAGMSFLLPRGRLLNNHRRYSRTRRSNKTLREAKNELLFHSMILVPHQVEVIFVICTLLSGRRKLFIQDSLLDLGLPSILRTMFFRMSWSAPAYKGENPFDHIHGPSCECNPESALRVQYLRLIHNLYDRDFVQCANKQSMLSTYEKQYIWGVLAAGGERAVEEVHVPLEKRGLASLLLHVLVSQPVDSIYRFWLSSCIESFLRGCRSEEQLFIVQCGLMKFLTTNILSSDASAKDMQTAFDLLGELIKNNARSLALLEALIKPADWPKFAAAVFRNLVDSNVFLRSLYLTMSASDEEQQPTAVMAGYCSHSWTLLVPTQLVVGPGSVTKPEADVSSLFAEHLRLTYDSHAESRSLTGSMEGYPRLHAYFEEMRETVLVKLLSAVMVRAMNHENICCVNSALLILLQDYIRGTLAERMIRFKTRAEEEVGLVDGSEVGPGNAILRNFRENLWYWREYYLKRGRDRLSLEFSSCRIPFACWRGLVDLLCADDGSACAVLDRPMHLPMSPYAHPGKQMHFH